MKERFFEKNFDAIYGLKQSYAITNMPFGSLLSVLNMNLDGRGGKSKRKGYTKLFNLPVTNKVLSLIDYHRSNGTSEVVAFANTTMYSWNGAAVSALITGLTVDTEWRFQIYQDRLLGVNGVNNNFTYNGTTYTKIGLSAPSGHVAVATNADAGSTLDGIYQYVVTFYDSTRGAESNPVDITTAPAVNVGATGTNDARLGPFPTVGAGESADKYRVYRMWVQDNAGNPQETIFTRVAEISYTTYVGTTYDDTGLTSGTIEIEYDTGTIDVGNTPPPQSKLIIEYLDRILMVDETDPTLLVYSQPSKPHAFPSANYHTIGDKDGGRILKLEKHLNSIIIHKKNGVFILTGNPASSIPARISGRGTNNYGTSISDVDGYVIRLSNDGIYLMTPTDYDNADLRDIYIGRDVVTIEQAIPWSDTSRIKMFNYSHGASQHVYLIIPSSTNYNSQILVFDYSLGSSQSDSYGEWMYYEVGTDIYSASNYQDSGSNVMIFGDGYGYIWKWNSGDADGYDLNSDELNGNATSSTANTISDTTQAWTVNGLVGATVFLRDGTGKNQRRRIASNTATQITIVGTWAANPDTTTQYSIAQIDGYAEEFWNSNDYENRWKRLRWIVPYVRQTGAYDVDVTFRKDFESGTSGSDTISLTSSTSYWGSLIWGSGLWGALSSTLQRIRFVGKYRFYSIKYRNDKGGEPFYWDGHGVCFQILSDRNG